MAKRRKKNIYPNALTLDQFAELCVDTVIAQQRGRLAALATNKKKRDGVDTEQGAKAKANQQRIFHKRKR